MAYSSSCVTAPKGIAVNDRVPPKLFVQQLKAACYSGQHLAEVFCEQQLPAMFELLQKEGLLGPGPLPGIRLIDDPQAHYESIHKSAIPLKIPPFYGKAPPPDAELDEDIVIELENDEVENLLTNTGLPFVSPLPEILNI